MTSYDIIYDIMMISYEMIYDVALGCGRAGLEKEFIFLVFLLTRRDRSCPLESCCESTLSGSRVDCVGNLNGNVTQIRKPKSNEVRNGRLQTERDGKMKNNVNENFDLQVEINTNCKVA